MLKTRILTASILLPIIIAMILYCNTFCIAITSAIILIVAAFEWISLIHINRFFILLFIAIGFICYYIPVYWIFTIACIWWIVGLVAVILYPNGKSVWKNKYIGLLIGCLLFIPSWFAIIWLYKFDPIMLIFVCALIWGVDICAYFIGKRWGKKKLLKQVSPKKTWIGVLGGLFGAIVIMLIFYNFYIKNNFWILLIFSIATAIISIVGDLVESMFKRMKGVKDSGYLLPGHGGVLDRIDSLLAGLPAFVFLFLQFIRGHM